MGGLFKASKPKVPEPERMPDTEDPAAEEARRRKRREVMSQGGRASTILDTGRGAYMNEKLGQ